MFRDRSDAGIALAQRLASLRSFPNVLVLALPRGGVPVAREVASALHAPLDVCLVRKLGVPQQPEYAFGAIAEDGAMVIDAATVDECGLRPQDVERVIHREQFELDRRAELYRGDRPRIPWQGRTIILVDDGLATGSTMLAAVKAIRLHQPERIIVAVPVGPSSTCAHLAQEADEVVCLATPEPFEAVGRWYQNFAQVSDAEVREALAPYTPQQ